MRAGVGVCTGVFRKVIAITGTARQSVKDNSLKLATRLGQERNGPDNGARRGLDSTDDENYRLNVLCDELSVTDGVDWGAI